MEAITAFWIVVFSIYYLFKMICHHADKSRTPNVTAENDMSN